MLPIPWMRMELKKLYGIWGDLAVGEFIVEIFESPNL